MPAKTSHLNRHLPLEIGQVSSKNLLDFLLAVRGHLKAASMLWMRVLGLPVLSGVIISAWSDQSARMVGRYCRRNNFTELLLRIDRFGQRWTNRRGGYLLPLARLPQVVRELEREHTIAILLEPLSPYKDCYSLVAVTAPEDRRITIEVVGPGFDASDILRSDVEPHQRFEVAVSLLGPRRDSPKLPRLTCVHTIRSEDYAKSVDQRLAKIGARLENPALPNELLKSPAADHKGLKSSALLFLKKSRQPLLLKHLPAYTPIPEALVARFVRDVLRMMDGLASYGIHIGPTTFSASFTSARRLVFWDFFPASPREASILYPKP